MKIAPSTGRSAPAKPKTKSRPDQSADTLDRVSLSVRNGISWGYKQARRQTNTLASVSSNVRIGTRQFRAFLSTGMESGLGVAGMYAGLAAAGLRASGGLEKLYRSAKKRELGTALDGVRDIGSAAVLGLASASKWAVRKTVLPIYAGFSTIRGGFNFAKGIKTGDKRLRSRGALDGIRSLGLTARSLKSYSPWLAVAGKALAPVAGVIQAGQGIQSLATGLKRNNNKQELKGVVDITSAIGTTLLLTGVAATPGLALFSAAQFIYSAYNMSSFARKILDKGIDKSEPLAHKTADGIRNLKTDLKETFEKLKSPFPGFGSDENDRQVDRDWKAAERRLEEDAIEVCMQLDEVDDEDDHLI